MVSVSVNVIAKRGLRSDVETEVLVSILLSFYLSGDYGLLTLHDITTT